MLFNLSIPVLTNLLVSKVLPQSDISLLFECFLAVLLIAAGMMAFSYLQSLMMLKLKRCRSQTSIRSMGSCHETSYGFHH